MGLVNNYFQSRVEYAVAHGIHFLFGMGGPGFDGGTVSQLVSLISGPLRNAVEAVEDPNEYNTRGISGWPAKLAAYDREVYRAVKASPSLRSVPVIGPPLVGADAPAQLGNERQWMDFGDVHPYMGGTSPSPFYIAPELQQVSAVSANKPVWATEFGFYTDAAGAPAGLMPVSEYVGAVYLLRQYLEDFRNGIQRSYAYELIDDFPDPAGTNVQDHFGLLRNNYTPKPAFYALKDLLSLVGQQAPPKLTPLPYSITSRASDLRQLVLQQTDHTYLLILWRNASIWNTTTRKPIAVPPATITLNLPTATNLTSADPITTNTPNQAPLTITNHQAHTQIGANPLIIKITTNQQATTHDTNTN